MSYVPLAAIQSLVPTGPVGLFLDDPRTLGVDASRAFSSYGDLLTATLVVAVAMKIRAHAVISANCSSPTTTLQTRIAVNGAPLSPQHPLADTAGQSNGKASVHVQEVFGLSPGTHTIALQWARGGVGTVSCRPLSSPADESASLYFERVE